MTRGASTPSRATGAWLTTTVDGFFSRRTMARVRARAAMSSKVGRTTITAASASTMASETSSTAPAGVSTSIRSVRAPTAAIWAAISLGPEEVMHSGPGVWRALSTSCEEAWGSTSTSRVFLPRRCAARAMWVATVVFPEPPLRAMIAKVRTAAPPLLRTRAIEPIAQCRQLGEHPLLPRLRRGVLTLPPPVSSGRGRLGRP